VQFQEFGQDNKKIFLKKWRNIQTHIDFYQGFTASGVILEIFLRKTGDKYM